jgi:ferredoxin
MAGGQRHGDNLSDVPTIALNDLAPAPLQRGQDLLGAMLDAGMPAMYLCMAGSCGRCRCRVSAGLEALAPLTSAEDFHGCAGDQRLACQARLAGEADVRVHQPPR